MVRRRRVVKRIDIQADEVNWDDDQRRLHQGELFTGQAVTYNWLDELRSLATYVDGFREGVQREWYGGQLKSDLTIHKGRLTGATREWDEDGNLVREQSHDDIGEAGSGVRHWAAVGGRGVPGAQRLRAVGRPGRVDREEGNPVPFERTGMFE
jgi:hypothetical protein